MGDPFDRDHLLQAFELLGADLARRGIFVELAVYGGGATMLQFAWRHATEDVGAVVREGYDEAALAPPVRHVAERMGLGPDWLNDAVGMYTPLIEDDTLFAVSGSYPAGQAPGLRTFLARPHYLLAMKLQALRNLDRGRRDLDDARALAVHLGIADADALRRLYVSIFDEEPHPEAQIRFGAVFSGDTP